MTMKNIAKIFFLQKLIKRFILGNVYELKEIRKLLYMLQGCKRRTNDLERKRIGEILQTLINPNAFPEA